MTAASRLGRSAGAPAGVFLIAVAYVLAYPLIIGRADESHLLHGARRVLDGQVLYRDFFEIITPLGFYFIAAAYWLGGTTLLTARIATALLEGVGAAALFVLVRRVAGTLEAALLVVVFLALCIPVWPFASPHWMSTAIGLLAAAVLLVDDRPTPARGRALAVGTLAGIAICVQQQRGVFLLLWLMLALPVLAAARPRGTRWRSLLADGLWTFGAAGLVCAIVLGHAAWAASPAIVIESLYGFAAESYGPRHAGATGWAGVIALTQVFLPPTWLWLLRISPVFFVVEGLCLLRHLRGPWTRPLAVRACLVLLAGTMALSVAYLPDFIHVSFVLPFLLIPGARVLHGVRTWTRLSWVRPLLTVALVGALAAVVVKGAGNVVRSRASAPVSFETAFGRLDGDDFLRGLHEGIRRHLVPEPSGRSTLYSYPNDAWMYLALPADDATRFEILAPSFPQRYLDEVVAAVRARRAGTIVLMTFAKMPAIEAAVHEGYDFVEEVPPYRIYVRRPPT